MSNAFRTPFLDTLRNLVAVWVLPRRRTGPFSLREYRSSIRTILLTRKSTTLNSSELGGVLDPKIIGGGRWFRFWSARVRKTLLARSTGPFSAPAELAGSMDFESIASLRRTMGALFFKFPKLHFPIQQVRGLEFQKRRLECHLRNHGKFEIRCDGTGHEFASYIKNRGSREKILKAYYGVFDQSEEFHTAILAVLEQRQTFAQSRGFRSWNELQLAASGIASEEAGSAILGHIYSKVQLGPKMHAMRKIPLDVPNSKGATSSAAADSTDESFLITSLRRGRPVVANPSVFEYKKVIERIVTKLETLFKAKISHAQLDLTRHGWHPTVLAFKVIAGEKEGFIYLDLFRRGMSSPLAGSPPHCSVLSKCHVRIHMGLLPPYRSEITFRKERNLTYEEITALWHEFGHAMHVLLRPDDAPVSQLPLDMREAPSILCELYSLTDECMDWLSENQLTKAEKASLKRDEFFYLDIIRNIAVSDFLHSSKFDPFAATPAQLREEARRVYSQFSPIKVAEFVNPLGGELSNYLLDGESRTGYLLSYIRASASMLRVRDGEEDIESLFVRFKSEFIDQVFPPFVSGALQRLPVKHPLPPIVSSRAVKVAGQSLFENCHSGALWDNCN